jgi:hypothetical protein
MTGTGSPEAAPVPACYNGTKRKFAMGLPQGFHYSPDRGSANMTTLVEKSWLAA